MSAGWVMRAIVWGSPPSGHWETSSKRLRQLTQRRRPGSWVGRSQGSPQFGHGARPRTLVVPVPGSAIVRLWRFGRRASDPALTEASIGFAGDAADEEAGGAVAVGAQLQRARLVGRGEARREGAEVVQFERGCLPGGRPRRGGG